jgi:hypothetical protein
VEEEGRREDSRSTDVDVNRRMQIPSVESSGQAVKDTTRSGYR